MPRFFRISPADDHNFRTLMLHNVFGLTSHNKKLLNEAYRKGKIEPAYQGEFPCDLSSARSPSIPDDINQLRPGDIDIVGVLGDSISAGNGIASTNPMQVSTENRGLSWSGGKPLFEKVILRTYSRVVAYDPDRKNVVYRGFLMKTL
ncbi:hypothetical protein WDU94_010562 [Cyamophila willieti]